MSEKQKIILRIACIVIAAILLLGLIAPAVMASEDDALYIYIADFYDDDGVRHLQFDFDNQTSSECHLGWAGMTLTIETSQQTYTEDFFSVSIPVGQSNHTLNIEDIDGELIKITVDELSSLDDRGLPGIQLFNQVIYQSDMEYQRVTFSYASSISSIFNEAGNTASASSNDALGAVSIIGGAVLAVVYAIAAVAVSMGPLLVLAFFLLLAAIGTAIMIILIVIFTRRNKKAKKEFDPFKENQTKQPPKSDASDNGNGFAPPPGL